ncbi:MAG: flavodoxin [Candidatus Bathyarchaeia archaeon]|jgi:flavodoxin
MKTLITYFSRTGTTKKLADELSTLLSADIEAITEAKSRAGPMGWLTSGREAMSGATPVIEALKMDPSYYDVVVIGTPIWAWNMASPIRSYLIQAKSKIRNVAYFCTYQSSPGSTFENMAKITGAPIVTLEIKETEVEIGDYKEKLKTFADAIKATQ